MVKLLRLLRLQLVIQVVCAVCFVASAYVAVYHAVCMQRCVNVYPRGLVLDSYGLYRGKEHAFPGRSHVRQSPRQ